MKFQLLTLGVMSVIDTATGLTGILTHARIGLDHRVIYLLQPTGLNPETGQPVDRMWVNQQRLKPSGLLKKLVWVEHDIPVDVLGTKVTEEGSGFSGTVIEICVMISGCVHLEIQPAGRLAKSNNLIASADFDIRRCSGPALKKMAEAARQKDQQEKPSPAPMPRSTPRT